jgi:hypothetical protein
MSTFRNPVGPQPSRVYWRRRLLVGLLLVALLVIILLIVFRPASGAPTGNDSSTTPAPNVTQTSAAPTDPDEAAACDLSKVSLEPITDATSYDPGINPALTFTIKSTMTVPCVIPIGSDIQEYRITSGEEVIWSSKDCQTQPVAAETVLMPGVPQSPAAITWDRTRSSADTCEGTREPVIAGGASYHLNVIVGEVEALETKQFLLY